MDSPEPGAAPTHTGAEQSTQPMTRGDDQAPAGAPSAAADSRHPGAAAQRSGEDVLEHPPRRAGPPRSRPPQLARRGSERVGDRLFRMTAFASAALLLSILVAIAMFLLDRALPAIDKDTTNFLTTKTWFPDDTPSVFGIAALVYGTVVTSCLAAVIAVPVAIAVALSVTQYLPRRLARPIGYLVDLLAAVPSVVYGLWGLFWLVPAITPLSRWLAAYFGRIPIFSSQGIFGKSIFTASVVLAIMILPLVAAISREVFLQVPREHQEAAYALGATKWEMIRLAVLPFGRPGLISALVLGIGRAMGETIAVALVLSANYEITAHLLTPGGNTIAANIANTFGDAGKVGQGALIASGLVLFAITLVVNFTGRAIIARRKEFRGAAA